MRKKENKTFEKNKDIDLIVPVYSQKYLHVRHLQNLRLNYLNYLLVITGISTTAIIAILSNLSKLLFPLLTLSIPTLIVWSYSLFTLSRIIRIDGHISHNFREIRLIEKFMKNYDSTLNRIFPKRSKPTENLEFNRGLLSKNNSIEHLVSLFFASMATLFFSIFLYNYFENKLCLLLIPMGLFFELYVYYSERNFQIQKHKDCCPN